jgi:hypothetical protein
MRPSLSAPNRFNNLASIAKPTLLAWEKLRILFIIVLGLVTVLRAGRESMKPSMLLLIAEGAVIANVLYFAGPFAEAYARWLGYDGKWMRWLLFVAGTVLTAILAIAAIDSVWHPDDF